MKNGALVQFDGKDLISVVEVYFYNESGERVIDKGATKFCCGLDMCNDVDNKLDLVRERVQDFLVSNGIEFEGEVEMENDGLID